MYCTPCARLMKSITPKTSVRPAAIRKSSTPSCRPFRVWTMRRVKDMALSYPPPCGEGRRPSVARSAGWGSRNVLIAATPPHRARFAHHPPHKGEGKESSSGRSLHRTIFHVRIGVVLEHLLHD